jgi:hypothetical protein
MILSISSGKAYKCSLIWAVTGSLDKEIRKMKTKIIVLFAFFMLPLLGLYGCTASTGIPAEAPPSISNPTFTAVPPPIPADVVPEPKTEWNLVVIGDSSVWGLGDALAALIEKEVNKPVVVHDFALSTLSAGEVVQVLETGKSTRFQLMKLEDALKKADFVVMFANPEDSEDIEHPNEIGSCFAAQAPGPCGLEVYDVYIDHLQFIWEKIYELKAGEPVILRAIDFYNPLIARWQATGVEEACTACWEHLNDAVRIAAERANVPYVSRFDVYNGLNHDEDPIQKGFISDGEHSSELGARVQAEAITKIGYAITVK